MFSYVPKSRVTLVNRNSIIKSETFYRFFAQNVELKTTQINVHSGRKFLQKVSFLPPIVFNVQCSVVSKNYGSP